MCHRDPIAYTIAELCTQRHIEFGELGVVASEPSPLRVWLDEEMSV